MSSCADVRKFALALEGVEEVDHWGRPAFRTKRRIFITLRPNEERAMFHIPEAHQELLFEIRPQSFAPLHWGKTTRCFINLKKVPIREIAALVREAWEYAGPAQSREIRKSTRKKVPTRRTRTRN
jgi:hypothetical protein